MNESIDFVDELRGFISGRIDGLPPSERPKFEAILGHLSPQKISNRLFFVTVNVSIPEEARYLEGLLRTPEVSMSQQATNWAPNGDLIVYMALDVSQSAYAVVCNIEHPGKSRKRGLLSKFRNYGVTRSNALSGHR